MTVEVVLLAGLGLVLGSFLNVAAYRLPIGENWASERSRCPHCKAPIAAYDNIPVVSWIVLRGKCRSCDTPISARYPLSETALAAAFVAVWFRCEPDGWLVALGCVFVSTLLVVTLTDLEDRIIPNRVLLASLVAAIALSALANEGDLVERADAGAIAFVILFAAALLYGRGMGMGDVKLAGLMGVYLGRAVAPALFAAFLSGAIFGLGLMALRGADARKQAVPFGPFLALGGLVGLFAGDEIVDWYTDSFFD